MKAALWAHDAFFEGDVPDPEAHIEDMIPVGPVMKVSPFQDRDIEFNVPSSKGKKSNGWSIIFSDKKGHCSDAADDAGLGLVFPDFLSIRAFDEVGGVGGLLGADTWKIGTGVDEPRLACLVKHKGDEFVGFFEMSFMYTVEICPVGEDECPAP